MAALEGRGFAPPWMGSMRTNAGGCHSRLDLSTHIWRYLSFYEDQRGRGKPTPLRCIESTSDDGEENTRNRASTTGTQAREPASGQLALALLGAAGGAHAKADRSSLPAW